MKNTARRRYNFRIYDIYPLLLILGAVTGIQGLSNMTIDIPEAVAVGTTVNLTCKYDLGQDVLYAVKWYKEKNEFYRYLPKEMPPQSVFGTISDKVDKNRSDDHHVVLTNVTEDLDGRYRCEVSSESPHFITMLVSSHLHVANLPNGKPEMHVEKPRYEIGDTIRGNCTTPSSNPPANVTWIINGHPVKPSYVNRSISKIDNRTRTIAGLEFEIIADSFKHGKLRIICHANVFQLYNERTDVELDEERPKLASVLGTRDSPHTGTASRSVAQWIYIGAAANLLLCGLR